MSLQTTTTTTTTTTMTTTTTTYSTCRRAADNQVYTDICRTHRKHSYHCKHPDLAHISLIEEYGHLHSVITYSIESQLYSIKSQVSPHIKQPISATQSINEKNRSLQAAES